MRIQFLFNILLPTGYSTNSSVIVRTTDMGDLFPIASAKIRAQYPSSEVSLVSCHSFGNFGE